jgi:tRNA pseudouridine32 synthase/23S rRNA pseudouridine746 synthase
LPARSCSIFASCRASPTIQFEAQILYHDAHLLVADKPHFLATMPAGRFVQQSLLVRLKNETRLDQLAPLHRLDRATAGVVLLSVDETTRHAYSALFAERRVEKTYEALAATQALLSFPLTRPSRIAAGEPFFRMRETDGEPNAQTQIDVIENRGDISLYRLAPLTGKKHQLRVHMAALGMAIINDRWYPLLQDESEDDYSRPLKLLARQARVHRSADRRAPRLRKPAKPLAQAARDSANGASLARSCCSRSAM